MLRITENSHSISAKSIPSFWFLFFSLILATGCSSSKEKLEPALEKEPKKSETASFGAGCYWCSEAIFQRVKGVREVRPGFMGQDKEATYQKVVDETTDFAEVSQVVFDPSVVTYAELLEVFFQIHDPTSVNRQGEDSGPLYRSVIFTHNKTQEELAKKAIERLNDSGVFSRPIVTDVEMEGTFISAKEKEFNYFNNNRENKHCQSVILPKIEKFKKAFQNLVEEKE